MAEGILQDSIARAPEHFRHGHDHLRASSGRARHRGVGIRHGKMNGHGRTAEMLGTEGAHLRALIRQHQRRVTDLQAAMRD
jgi:hypothetical protein